MSTKYRIYNRNPINGAVYFGDSDYCFSEDTLISAFFTLGGEIAPESFAEGSESTD
jgi:hypothetical protein